MQCKKSLKVVEVILVLSITIVVGIGVNWFKNSYIENNDDILQEECIETRGIIHISFDDTIEMFLDLTRNEEKYTSIFENKFLGFLKEMHDKYEAVFSLYCFYQNADGTFNLSMCTNKFANEFQENSDWLKVGFHNVGEEGNLADATAEEATHAYELIVSELVRITGGTEALDRVVRLQNFAGNSDVIEALVACENGIEGLYTADDKRQSYYLEKNDNLYMQENDYLEEKNLGIEFISTDERLDDSLNVYNDLKMIVKEDNQNKIIEIFTHEWKCDDMINFELTKQKIEVCCKFAQKYGYKWSFVLPSELGRTLSVF